MKKLSPAEKAWATRRANRQRQAQKRGGGQRRGHRGKRKKHKVVATGFKKIKKGPRKGEVFPVLPSTQLTPAQKAWQTRRQKTGVIRPQPKQKNGHDQYKHQWLIPSRSQKGKFYTVSVTYDGVWLCSCPAWIFQGGPIADRSSCPHIQEVQRIAGVKVKPRMAKVSAVHVDATQTRGHADLERQMKAQEMLARLKKKN